MVERVEPESFWLCYPGFADEFVWCQAAEGLQTPAVVVGIDEVSQVRPELPVGVVVIALDSRVLDGPVHAFHLVIGPGVFDLCEPVLDAILAAAHIEHVRHELGSWTVYVTRRERELDAVVGQHGVDFVGDRLDHAHQEGRCGSSAGLGDQLHDCKLTGAIDSHIEVELAFASPDFGDIDVT